MLRVMTLRSGPVDAEAPTAGINPHAAATSAPAARRRAAVPFTKNLMSPPIALLPPARADPLSRPPTRSTRAYAVHPTARRPSRRCVLSAPGGVPPAGRPGYLRVALRSIAREAGDVVVALDGPDPA